MKTLQELLEGLSYEVLQGTLEKEIESVVFDSRKAGQNSLFICIEGAVVDGHHYAADVIQKGASVLLVNRDIRAEIGRAHV